MTASSRFLGGTERAVLAAAQQVFLPPEQTGPLPDLSDSIEILFGRAKCALKVFLRMALWAIELSPLFFCGVRFSRLAPQARHRWVERLERSRGPGRSLFLVLKVLMYTNAYDEPALGRKLMAERS